MTVESSRRRHFASDNYAGMCPEALAALLQANEGHEVSYGDDTWTEKASNLIREVFETNCEVFFVFNGTSANSLSLASLCQSYHSILCHELAHVEVAECGAPEFFANGTKDGTAVGEAVVFFNLELAREFDYRCKQGGQLASKMRFLSAPWVGMLQDGAWLRHAKHANAMAQRLETALRKIPQITIAFPVESNGVFAKIPSRVVDGLHQRGWKFYTGVVT